MGEERIKISEINKLSLKYIHDNPEEVCSRNQRLLVAWALLYFVVLIAYNIIVPVFFASWGVNYVYQIALVLHIVVLAIILLRYRKKNRAEKEVRIVCAIFQLYIMSFVIIVSILPFEMEQPAIYFAPIAMAFSVMFIFSYKASILLCIIEAAAMIAVSWIFKTVDVANINMFATILALLVEIYACTLIYTSRIKESKHRKKLRKMGQTDKLTSLYNRAATEMLSQDYIRENRDSKYALMIIDVDEFKSVNDTYGHQTGDMVLTSVASIIKEASGTLNIAGRMGGDEFLIFVKNWETRDDIEQIAAQILRNVPKIKMPDEKIKISCSIGVCALFENEWLEFDEMFSCADKALYYIKENGKNCCAFYSKKEKKK